MKGVLLFFLMIVVAVILGLVIAYWYLRRFEANGGRVLNTPRAVPFPEKHPPVDVTPTSPDLLEHRADVTGAPDGADIDGLMRRLDAIKTKQEGSPEARPAPANDTTSRQPQPLSSAKREKDDLKQISGIGPKLERLLHDNGIVSFGQIAEWQEADIRAFDQLLTAFHGRIQREDWVGQARKLRDEGERSAV